MRVLTLTEAARLARCSKLYLRKVLAGKVPEVPPLPVVRLSRVLIREAALEHWLLQLERMEMERQLASGLFITMLDKENPEDSGK